MVYYRHTDNSALQLRLRLRRLCAEGALGDEEDAAAAELAGAAAPVQRTCSGVAPPNRIHGGVRKGAFGVVRNPYLGGGGAAAAATAAAAPQDEHAECPVCFDRYVEGTGPPPPQRRICVLTDGRGKRVCRHFFHVECCPNSLGTCPMCRAKFAKAVPLPDISVKSNWSTWFRLIDADGDGKLSKREVVDVLRVTLPVVDNLKMIEQYVDQVWRTVDSDGSGTCEIGELPGLFRELGRQLPGQQKERAPPKLSQQSKVPWFHFWDEDNGGTLSQGEIVRALTKTFRHYGNAGGAQSAKGTVEAVWSFFDHDGSGELDMQEFCSPDGLADALIMAAGG